MRKLALVLWLAPSLAVAQQQQQQPQQQQQQPPPQPQPPTAQPPPGQPQPSGQPPPPPAQPPPPPGYQYPQNGYPPPQGYQYPQNGYPPPQGYQYPQNGYPPPQYPYTYPPGQQQYPYGAPPPSAYPTPPPGAYPNGYPVQGDPYTQAPKLPRMVLQPRSEAAVAATWACADALDRHRPDLARQKCGEALAKDDNLAYAHYLLALAAEPDTSRKELRRAVESERYAGNGERLFIEAYRAVADGRTQDARRLYDQLVATLPGEPRAWAERARFRITIAGDAEGAIYDLNKAVAIDPKWGAAQGELALALAERGQLDEALAAAKKYVDAAPTDAAAQLALARVQLKRNDAQAAAAAAKKAVATDDKLTAAHAALGDALLFAGKGKEARKEYATLIGNDDPTVHHAGAMREARSWVFEGRLGEAEKSLAAEADLAMKTKRPGDEADARIELARLQLDRSAVGEAGQTARQTLELLQQKELEAAMTDEERRRYTAAALEVRAMVLGAIGERQIADQRADEVGQVLRQAGDPRAADKATSLKGWIAARNHDDKTALVELAVAAKPTLRMALALAVMRGGDRAAAKRIMEELAKRADNDLEVALTRPRALAWLKTQK